MSTPTPTVRPFSSGTQYLDWTCSNCDTCSKQAPPDAALDEMPCPIEAALAWAALDEGRVPLPLAERMGYTRHKGDYVWPCPEHDPPFINAPAPLDADAQEGE